MKAVSAEEFVGYLRSAAAWVLTTDARSGRMVLTVQSTNERRAEVYISPNRALMGQEKYKNFLEKVALVTMRPNVKNRKYR